MKKLLLFLTFPLLVMAAVSCDGILTNPDGPNDPDDPDNPGVDDPALNEIIEFKDPNFLKALLTVQKMYFHEELWMGDDTYVVDIDTNKDGKISVGEASKVKALSLTRYGEDRWTEFHVKEMPEIKYFTSLEYLDFGQSTLTSLDVSENKNLKVLVGLGDNAVLTNIKVSGCINLHTIYIEDSLISEIDLSNCPELRKFHLGYYYNESHEFGHITCLDVSKNIKLKDLFVEGQLITSLDISNNKELVNLDCAYCQLGSLDVSNNQNLVSLFCAGNRLTELDLSANAELIDLFCENNMLSGLDLSNCPYLEELHCSDNELTELDLRNNYALVALWCSNNSLEKIVLPWAIKLGSISIDEIIREYGNIIEYVGAPIVQLNKIELSEHESYTSVACNIKVEDAAGIRTCFLIEEKYNEELESGQSDYDIVTSRFSNDESQDVVEKAATAGGYDWNASNCYQGTKYIFIVMVTFSNGLYRIEKAELQTAKLVESESWELVSESASLVCGMFPGLDSEIRIDGVIVYKHTDADIFKIADPFYNIENKFPTLQIIFANNRWFTERGYEEYYTVINALNPEKVSIELDKPTTVQRMVSGTGGDSGYEYHYNMWLYSKAHDDSRYSFGKYDKENGIIGLGHIVWACYDIIYDTEMTSSLILK